MQIKNQVALVTGAASGMGAACAEALEKAGAKVMCLDLHEQMLKNKSHAYAVDVSDEAALTAVFENIKATHGAPRIVVHCAGVVAGQRLVGKEGAMPLADFERVIRVNLIGTCNVMRLAAAHMSTLPALHDDERGVIITTASVAAFEGQIGQVAYSASKGGVVSMTLPAARELSRFGIRVVCVAPGLMSTPMMNQLPEAVQKSLIETSVFPKRLGEADEFARLAMHVVENTFLNGCVLRLDGSVRLAVK